MHIPEELSNLPTHIVEIFLAGIEPHDKEYTWNKYTNKAVHDWYSKKDERSYVTGKVSFYTIMSEKYTIKRRKYTNQLFAGLPSSWKYNMVRRSPNCNKIA